MNQINLHPQNQNSIMTRFVYNIVILLLGILPVFANDGEFTKNFHKEYDVPADATVELINRYGYTKVHAWDKRIVTIDVNIIANTTSKDRAEEIFEKIDINFTTTSNYIKAETTINNTSKSWWDWKSWLGGSNGSSYKINYDVYMPTDQFLKLTHKYGDAFVDRLERDATIKVSYGHLRMDGLGANLDLDLAYSDGNIGSFNDGKLNLRYSNISMGTMKDGILNFKYSDIKMKEGGDIKAECAYGELDADLIHTLDIHSRYDDITVDYVGDVYVNSGYSDLIFGKIGKKSTFTSTYGDIIIKELDPSFQSIDIKTSYVDVRIGAHGTSYRLDASGSYADIKTTGDFTSNYLVEKSNSKTVKGYTKSESSGGIIKATLAYGGLRID